MLKNTIINRKATGQVALALGELNKDVVYVGGAMVSLYIDDPAAEDVRPTKDIDITLEIANVGELEKLRVALEDKGFVQSAEDDVICRFRLNDIKVDVMSTTEVGWAPANPWFAPGFENSITKEVEKVEIRILTLPYFLATKFAAFQGRGGGDPRMSHDFEDIVYLLNYTSSFKDQIQESDPEVKHYLKEQFLAIRDKRNMQEAIIGNLYHENQEVRFDRIMKEIKEITKET
ncbi:nucleotidyl transferase AbiEii/AbiGii toxin family protein [Gramella sp. GC03-9]|uniref:Nucleotidyl transferase AbiEii/AbiGii toxin family protein n=1 Tax=Christiangramia oceanisediminis TaxID=2920386 RepID=A0A9X2KYP0_9FLAO|nr:nucleotidyl transferase AbiEii/AbiGii toxin family protein [Gramella oceanisediminis]MCP9200793.1 nucleotidyl transferase AbiEii/AbiGii toxin family protein [Gramella oceanisediminis]